MKVAIYSRKSKFTGKGDSIENQIQLCMDYGKNIGVTDFLVYEDEGFSEKNTNRPEFTRMIEDAKDKKFDTIICQISLGKNNNLHLIYLLHLLLETRVVLDFVLYGKLVHF